MQPRDLTITLVSALSNKEVIAHYSKTLVVCMSYFLQTLRICGHFYGEKKQKKSAYHLCWEVEYLTKVDK